MSNETDTAACKVPKWRRLGGFQTDLIWPSLLILGAIAVSGSSIYVSASRPLSNLENAMLQAFSLLFGVLGSFVIGKNSATDAARQLIKPHARSAFRRLMSLYESLSRVAFELEHARDNREPRTADIAIAKLEAMVIEQLATADDALEDWRDIVPEDVEELQARLLKRRGGRT